MILRRTVLVGELARLDRYFVEHVLTPELKGALPRVSGRARLGNAARANFNTTPRALTKYFFDAKREDAAVSSSLTAASFIEGRRSKGRSLSRLCRFRR